MVIAEQNFRQKKNNLYAYCILQDIYPNCSEISHSSYQNYMDALLDLLCLFIGIVMKMAFVDLGTRPLQAKPYAIFKCLFSLSLSLHRYLNTYIQFSCFYFAINLVLLV